MTLAESLNSIGWRDVDVAEHLRERYGYLSSAEAEQIVGFASQALEAGEKLQGSYGETLIEDSGAPCVPGLSGSDWTIGYSFKWTDPDTGVVKSWHDTLTVSAGTSVQDIFDGSADLFEETVGDEYLGGDVLGVSGYTFTIESAVCPA